MVLHVVHAFALAVCQGVYTYANENEQTTEEKEQTSIISHKRMSLIVCGAGSRWTIVGIVTVIFHCVLLHMNWFRYIAGMGIEEN